MGEIALSEQVDSVSLQTLLGSADPSNYGKFNLIISTALAEGIVTKEELAAKSKVSVSKIDEWATKSHPNPGTRAIIYRYLKEKCDL